MRIEALELINSSEYGLLVSVFTRDLARGLRFAEEVRSGWVNVNELTELVGAPSAIWRPGRLAQWRWPGRRPVHLRAPDRAEDDYRDTLIRRGDAASRS